MHGTYMQESLKRVSISSKYFFPRVKTVVFSENLEQYH